MMMKNDALQYEPPKARIYRFDDNDRVLTASGNAAVTTTESVYAAFALNEFFSNNGVDNSTTIEDEQES